VPGSGVAASAAGAARAAAVRLSSGAPAKDDVSSSDRDEATTQHGESNATVMATTTYATSMATTQVVLDAAMLAS
jgi:hypothetical protein